MKRIIYSVIVLFLLSCSERNKESEIVLDLSKNLSKEGIHPDFLLNELAEDITYVQLKSNDTLFHSDLCLSSVNDRGDFCFCDRGNNGAISIYDKKGELLSHFNRTGRGEGEFIEINSLFFDGEDKIEVLYSNGNSLYEYNRKGEFKGKYTVDRSIAMRSVGHGKYLSLRRIDKGKDTIDCVRVVDTQGKVYEKFLLLNPSAIKEMIYIHTEISLVRCENGYNFPITTHQGDVSYYNYDIKKNGISKICQFDLGNLQLTMDALMGGSTTERCIVMVRPVKVGRYLFVQFYYDRNEYVDIWDLTTAKIVSRVVGELSYRLPNGEVFKNHYASIFAHNDQLVLTCSPSFVAGKIKQTIDPEGNDVIVTFKF